MSLKRTPIQRKSEFVRGGPLNQFSSRRLAELDAAGIKAYSTLTPVNRGHVPAQREAQNRQARRSRPRDTGPSAKTRAIVRARSGGRCEYPSCPRPAQEVHHRDERGQGGRGPKAPGWINLAGNLLDACRPHNQWASNGSPAEAREMGWLIEMGQATPYTVPVLTRHHPEKVYLFDDGSWMPVSAVVV